jgi:hypothetical protein
VELSVASHPSGPDQVHLSLLLAGATYFSGTNARVGLDGFSVCQEWITEWLPKWIRNHWRNSKGTAVANRSLWNALVEIVKRVKKVKWTWLKGHSGVLLNECADMLATKGVNNEQPPALVQYLVPTGEDTDTEVYELKDCHGDLRTESTHVMKEGDNLVEHLSREPTSDELEPEDLPGRAATTSSLEESINE